MRDTINCKKPVNVSLRYAEGQFPAGGSAGLAGNGVQRASKAGCAHPLVSSEVGASQDIAQM